MGRKQRRGASRIALIPGGGAAPSPTRCFLKNPTLPLLGSRRRRRQPQPQQPQPQPAPQPPQPQQLLKDR